MSRNAESDIKIVENVLYAELLKGAIDIKSSATRIVLALHGIPEKTQTERKTHSKNTEDAAE